MESFLRMKHSIAHPSEADPNQFTVRDCGLLKMLGWLSTLSGKESKHFMTVPRPWVIWFILSSDLIFCFYSPCC